MSRLKQHLTTLLTVRWQPGQDTLVALISAVVMIPVPAIGTSVPQTEEHGSD